MKKMLSALFLCAAPVVLTAQVKYTLKGKVGTLSDPAKIYLRYAVDGETKMDSAVLQNGQFSFSGNLTGPVLGWLQLNHQGVRPAGNNGDFLRLYLGDGTVNLNSSDSIKNATVTGSKLNDDFKRLTAALVDVTEKGKKWSYDYNVVGAEKRKDRAFQEVMSKRSDSISAERRAIYKKFITENPGSFVSLDNIRMAVGYAPDYAEVAPLYNSLSPALKGSVEGKKMAEKLERLKAISVGAVAPDFTQNDTSGIPVKLSAFRGKYVLVDFWASWCGPCRAESPNVVKSYNKFKEKNFTVLGVSLDRPNDKEKWLKAIKDDQLYWTQVSDLAFWKNAVAQLYEVQAIPQNFLIDPHGKIVARDLHGEELDKKLGELLN